MILLLKYKNKTNICFFFNGGFTFSVFILWFWLFCGFCALISVGVIWFVIWWAFGSLLWFDFGWILAVVVVVIWFWLGFASGAWLEVMSLESSSHGGLEGELSLRGRARRDEKGFRPRIWRGWDLGSNHRGVVALMLKDGAWWSAMEHRLKRRRSERGRRF